MSLEFAFSFIGIRLVGLRVWYTWKYVYLDLLCYAK